MISREAGKELKFCIWEHVLPPKNNLWQIPWQVFHALELKGDSYNNTKSWADLINVQNVKLEEQDSVRLHSDK